MTRRAIPWSSIAPVQKSRAAICAPRKGARRSKRFFANYCADELRGPPRVLYGEGHSFSDVAQKVVSIINLASVADLETVVGAPVGPLRFRGNLYVSGWPAWHEFDLMGAEIAVGNDVRLKVVKRIVRCAATNVDPDTGIRDLTIPATLQQTYGHSDCGVYAQVIAGGEIALGDTLSVAAGLTACLPGSAGPDAEKSGQGRIERRIATRALVGHLLHQPIRSHRAHRSRRVHRSPGMHRSRHSRRVRRLHRTHRLPLRRAGFRPFRFGIDRRQQFGDRGIEAPFRSDRAQASRVGSAWRLVGMT